MPRTLSINPITRIEGHLSVRVEIESNEVIEAFCSGEMFRGFEQILTGRDPLDAQRITQRICGVCPVGHGIASISAQDDAYEITPATNGRLLRNLILGANYIQSHILHFYHLAALDFVDITAILQYRGSDSVLNSLKDWVQAQLSSGAIYPCTPFLPRYESMYAGDTEFNLLAIKHYLDALDMRALAHQALAIFGGKMPHVPALVPGGVTESAEIDKIAAFQTKLRTLQTFIDECYIPDVFQVAAAFPGYFDVGEGCGNFLAYGVFPETDDLSSTLLPAGVVMGDSLSPLDASKITEYVHFSFYSSQSGLRPAEGQTIPAPMKPEAYSWLKAPRYDGQVMEVGPLARILIAYLRGHPTVVSLVDGALSRAGKTPNQLRSVLGRHLARAIECKVVADRCAEWLEQIIPGEPTFEDFNVPESAYGVGLTEAPRGALGHWISISNGRISNYQCVVPTTWNCSPRDDNGRPGAVEQALVGLPVSDPDNPIEVGRVVRSFDPCIACSVH